MSKSFQTRALKKDLISTYVFFLKHTILNKLIDHTCVLHAHSSPKLLSVSSGLASFSAALNVTEEPLLSN